MEIASLTVKDEKANCIYNNICHLCLSLDRRVQSLPPTLYVLLSTLSITDVLTEMKTCWECCQRLKNMEQFRHQVQTASRQMIDISNGENNISPACLSNLGTAKNKFEIELSYENDNDEKIQNEHNEGIDIKVEDADHFLPDDIWTEPIFDVPIEKTEIKDDNATFSDSNCYTNESNTKVDKKVKKRPVKEKITKTKRGDVFDDSRVKVVFPTEEEVERYRNEFFEIRKSKYKCVECITSLDNSDMLRTHNLKYHCEEETAVKCDQCSCRFKKSGDLKQHKLRHSHFCLYYCLRENCTFVHHIRRYIVLHAKRHREKETDRFATDKFECDYCGFVCEARKQMFTHIKRHIKRHTCEHCGYSASRRPQLKIHLLSHLGPEHRPHECALCGKRFTDKYKLQVHSNTHSGEKTPCEFCGRAFADKHQLTYHIKTKHTHGQTDKKTKRAHRQTGEKAYKPRTKPLFAYRVQDFKFKENPGTYGEPYEDKLYDCSVCNQTFKRPVMIQHMKTHSDERPEQCSVCGKRFKQKIHLQAHMASHSKERKFPCDLCNASFKLASGLWTHKLIHKGEKPHECHVCGAKFTYKGNLTSHMKIHSGYKPHQCDLCGKKFLWKKDLRTHASKVHPGILDLAS